MTTTATVTVPHAYRRFLLLGVWIPLVAVLVALVLQMMWLGELPNPAATHFSGNGPDDFGPAWTYPLITAGTGGGMLLMTGISGAILARRGQWSVSPRLLASLLAATVLMLTIGLTLTANSQRGLTDARLATDPGAFLLLGAGIGVAYGIAAWFLQPSLTIHDGEHAVVTPSPLASGTKAAWMKTARVGGAGLALMVLGVGLVLVMAIIMTATGASEAWVMWLLTTLMFALFATMFVFRVRIDETGFSARSIVGIPAFRIPLDQVAEARSVNVTAIAEFGGWGLRLMPGSGFGIILRSGEALQIARTNGKKLTITVDDSLRAAELLLGLRDHGTS